MKGLRRFRISTALLINLLQGLSIHPAFAIERGLPDDAEIVSVHHSPFLGIIEITVRSADFTPISGADVQLEEIIVHTRQEGCVSCEGKLRERLLACAAS